MRESQGRKKARKGTLVFQKCAESLHGICWTSGFARRSGRSTSTEELLDAADAVDKTAYYNYLLEEISDAQTTELTADTREIFQRCSAFPEPKEAKIKILLVSIREEHNQSSLKTLRWLPSQRNVADVADVADSVARDNLFISKHLDDLLAFGTHKHDKSLNTASSDIPSLSTGGLHPTFNDDELSPQGGWLSFNAPWNEPGPPTSNST